MFIALLLRLALSYFQYSGDVKNHLAWGQSALSAGTAGLYSRHFAGFNDANYPPVTIYFFTATRFSYQLVNGLIHWQNFHAKFLPSFLVPLFETENMQAAFMKLPAILADLGIGLLIYLIFEKQKKFSLWLSGLYLFNPATIYVSAVWGQIESLPIFFLLLSYFCLWKKKNYYFVSHLAFCAAVLTKQTALWVLPVYLILWLKEAKVQKLIAGLLLQLAVFFVLYLPFLPPFSALSSYFATLSGSSTLVGDQAMNLWFFIFAGRRVEDSLTLFGLSIRLWSLILLALSVIFVSISLWKKFTVEKAANGLLWLSLLAFFFQTRVHERHLAPALVFLLISDYRGRNKILFYFLLSAYYMYNLYQSLRLPFI